MVGAHGSKGKASNREEEHEGRLGGGSAQCMSFPLDGPLPEPADVRCRSFKAQRGAH